MTPLNAATDAWVDRLGYAYCTPCVARAGATFTVSLTRCYRTDLGTGSTCDGCGIVLYAEPTS